MKFAVAALAVLSGVASASAADLAPHSYTKVPIAAPNTDWSGFYVGVTAGYGWGNASAAEAPANSLLGALLMAEPGVLPSSLSPKMSNGIGGGEIGYSWQFGRVVAGFEADISYLGMNGQDSFFSPPAPAIDGITTTQSNKLDWLGTVRGRLGWLATSETLLFGTGGLAYGGAHASTTVFDIAPGMCPALNAFCSTGSSSRTLVGWTLGAGVESKLTANWSVKAEYLYFDLGHLADTASTTISIPAVNGMGLVTATSSFRGSIVRAGVNYSFNNPVVAKY
jgi:outer membrane immunogenic protein